MQVKIIFFYCEAPREKAVPELLVSLPFGRLSFTILKEKKMVYLEIQWKSELSDPLWGRKKKDVWAKAAKHTNHLWHGFLAFRFSFWVSSGELKFPPRIRVSSGYSE